MLDSPPRESEARSWAWVALGIGVVYATIPVARALREVVDREVGREIFVYLCLAAILAGGVLAWRSLRRRRLGRGAYLWLALILAAFAASIYRLRAIPEEALHVAEYALLGILFYRALCHRVRDYSIFPLAALLTGMVGTVDEYIQWVVPSRYYDVDDIEINFFSGLLAQLALALGLRPRLVARRPDGDGWSRLCYTAAAALLLLLIAFVNTPQRVAWYAERLPGLEFLLDGSSMMAQYGHLHRSDAGGEFRSRFDAAELAELDRRRGLEVAGILDRYLRGEGYAAFLQRHSIIRDPYAHEAGVHLFRREYYIDRAREAPLEAGPHYTIAYFENDIMKSAFPTALGASRHRWSAAVEAEVAAGADTAAPYLSRVSSAVITRIGEREVVALFGLALALTAGGGFLLARRQRRRGAA